MCGATHDIRFVIRRSALTIIIYEVLNTGGGSNYVGDIHLLKVPC